MWPAAATTQLHLAKKSTCCRAHSFCIFFSASAWFEGFSISFVFFVCSCLFPLAFHFMIFASRFPFPVLLCLRCAQCKVPTLSEIENFCRLFFFSCLNFYLACAIFNSSQCDCCCRCPAICLSVLSIYLSPYLSLCLSFCLSLGLSLWDCGFCIYSR